MASISRTSSVTLESRASGLDRWQLPVMFKCLHRVMGAISASHFHRMGTLFTSATLQMILTTRVKRTEYLSSALRIRIRDWTFNTVPPQFHTTANRLRLFTMIDRIRQTG